MRDITYPAIIVTAKLAFKALDIKFRIVGDEHVPTNGPAILAVNHISYVDFIFGGFATQRSKRLVRFMAKRELFDHRWTGPLMRSLHHIEVDRDEGTKAYQPALDYLAAGEIVGVFPEATISRSFELKEFKSGPVRLAMASGVPIIPLILWGTQRMYTKDHSRDFSRGKTVSLTVGEPFHVTESNAVAETKRLRARMSTLLDETIRNYPDHQERAWWVPERYGGTAPTPEKAQRLDAEEKRRRAQARRAKRQHKTSDTSPDSSD
ncbi:MAG: 1-acyl-sn-glycerol-3-phosphate acyltransferase [Propionibacteriales bacterium]|nr:1-acyl-sn-glycerol-3-phosphate acyltransferase [Propionibacteriales bacterium]